MKTCYVRTLPSFCFVDLDQCCQISDARFLNGENLAFRAASIIAPLRSAVDFHPFLSLELHGLEGAEVQFKEVKGMKIHLVPDLATLDLNGVVSSRLVMLGYDFALRQRGWEIESMILLF